LKDHCSIKNAALSAAFFIFLVVSNGKRFITYEIIKRLEQKGFTKILSQLREGLTERDVAKGQKHKGFEDGFDAKPIYHRNFLLQKINYIHLNCVRGKMQACRTLGRL
jgi:hypothetical protein